MTLLYFCSKIYFQKLNCNLGSVNNNSHLTLMTQISPAKFLFILALVSVTSILLNVDLTAKTSDFNEWKSQHKIVYQSEFQNEYRRKIFEQNKLKIQAHNSNSHHTYKMGLNQFSALTQEEFIHQYLAEIQIQKTSGLELVSESSLKAADIDWTTQGAVTPIKNQGQCAAAWVFSTTGPLEGLTKIADGTLKALSDQQLVDCAGTGGCHGGFPGQGFTWVKQHGICTAEEYPWKGVGQACQKTTGSFKISSIAEIRNSCTDLSNAIHKGPVSVVVDATNWATYASGIFNNCGTSVNHAVTLVGQIQGVWKVKNSWGTSWGERGFIRLAAGNTCAICSSGILPNK